MRKGPVELLNQIAQVIFDKKGFNILALDVRHVSTLTDYFLIAEGTADRHVMAMGTAITEVMKGLGERPIHVEGLKSGEWVVLDYLEIVVHLFKPGLRDKYQLEELWHEGKIVDLELDVKVHYE